MMTKPSPGYNVLIRLEILSKPRMLGKVTLAIDSEDYIIPSVLNRKAPEKVSYSVKEAAIQTGVARPEQRHSSLYRV
jgi:malic enzyme